MITINQQRLVQSFLDLVQIDSESRHERAIAEHLAKLLAQLGFEVSQQAVPEEISDGFNIYARLPGTLPGSVVLSCHMDTVTPGKGIVPVIEDGVIRSQGETILGGDDKSGIAAILEAVLVLKEQQLAHQTIELAFTVHEEGGLHGAREFDLSMVDSTEAIVLDSGGPIGTMIVQAPGQQNIKATIIGRPAHAGLAPEEGINALTVASDAITSMKLSRIDHETTANIGVVRGGEATNIVMPELYLEAEARSLRDDKLAAQASHMVEALQAAAEKHGADIRIETTRAYNAFRVAEDDALVERVSQAFASIGIEAQAASTGGGSDANIFTSRGLKTLNLSTGMAKVHTTDEYIAVSDMVEITRFMVAYLSR